MEPTNPREVIQDLIETCKDGETGYLHAATAAESTSLKVYFQERSQERARFMVELTGIIRRMGEESPDTTGSTAAVLHRAWFEVKNDLGGGDHTLLESVEQGEDHAKASYQSALQQNLPPHIETVVRQQFQSVRAAHDKVRTLRDQMAGKAASEMEGERAA